MHRFLNATSGTALSCLSRVQALALLGAIFLVSGGCAAMTNPLADGIPVRRLPPELLAPSKEGEETIPLTLLRQPPPKMYRLAPGDVLGVYVEGFLGERTVPLPVHVSPLVQIGEQRRLPPASGYPVTVQEDGKIALPLVPPLTVAGLSLPEAREAIRKLYLDKQLLRPENDRISVTLLQARQYQVLVMRQETSAFSVGLEGPIGSSKRGTGHVVNLPAYENDVLHALALTGGLPGLDAYNEIIIQRDIVEDMHDPDALLKRLETLAANCNPLKTFDRGAEIIRIPLRQPPGTKLDFRREDIILRPGDVVFLEAREDQWFYVGGLLPPGKHLLPRDHNLDVVEAVAEVRGPLINGAFGGSNLSGDLIRPGIGDPSPTLLTVLRRIPGGGQVAIRVDLGRALRDPQERILVQAGDLLVLQEKPGEAFARYFSQTFLNFDVVWQIFRSSTATGVLDVSAPDRLTGTRLGTVTIPGQ